MLGKGHYSLAVRQDNSCIKQEANWYLIGSASREYAVHLCGKSRRMTSGVCRGMNYTVSFCIHKNEATLGSGGWVMCHRGRLNWFDPSARWFEADKRGCAMALGSEWSYYCLWPFWTRKVFGFFFLRIVFSFFFLKHYFIPICTEIQIRFILRVGILVCLGQNPHIFIPFSRLAK